LFTHNSRKQLFEFGLQLDKPDDIRKILLSLAPASRAILVCPHLALENILNGGNLHGITKYFHVLRSGDEILIAFVCSKLNAEFGLRARQIHTALKSLHVEAS
jgi:hypothetical protein